MGGGLLRVAIVENNFSIGGIQKLAVHQLQLLDPQKFDLMLVTLSQPTASGDFYDLVPQGIPVHKLHFTGFFSPLQWIKLARIFSVRRPDVVKSSGYFSNTIVRALQPFFGYRVIAAEHNTNIVRTWLQSVLNRLLDRVTHTTVVDSIMVREHLAALDQLPAERFTVIYNGVDLDAVSEARKLFGPQRSVIRQELGIGETDVVFLSVARLVHQKNHELMIDSFASVHAVRPQAKLLIVGDGALAPALRAQAAERGLSGAVIFLGERRDVHRFYAISDFTLLTSRHEGFCIAAMEGLAFGSPLISTRVAGVSEYLKESVNGLFVESTPQDISEKMVHMIDMPHTQLQSFKDAARQTAAAYSLAAYGEAYEALLERCCGSLAK